MGKGVNEEVKRTVDNAYKSAAPFETKPSKDYYLKALSQKL